MDVFHLLAVGLYPIDIGPIVGLAMSSVGTHIDCIQAKLRLPDTAQRRLIHTYFDTVPFAPCINLATDYQAQLGRLLAAQDMSDVWENILSIAGNPVMCRMTYKGLARHLNLPEGSMRAQLGGLVDYIEPPAPRRKLVAFLTFIVRLDERLQKGE